MKQLFGNTLHLLTALLALFGHDALVEIWQQEHGHGRNMLGFGIGVHYFGWLIVILNPIAIWLGQLWRKNWWRLLPQVILLLLVSCLMSPNFHAHPRRTLLFVGCCWMTLPVRMLIDRRLQFTPSRDSGSSPE